MHLTRAEIRILQRAAESRLITESDAALSLFRSGLLKRCSSGHDSEGFATGSFYVISADGLRWLESHRSAKSDQRWTRGLAIAAIIVSIGSLLVSGLTLYLQYLSQLQ